MARATLSLALVALAFALAPAASAASVCVGTGQLCVGASAAAPLGFDGDAVSVTYEVSSTTFPAINVEDQVACGAVSTYDGHVTRTGAGCASEDLRTYVFHQRISGFNPGDCYGVHDPTGVAGSRCVGVGDDVDCRGAWFAQEGRYSPDFFGVIAVCGYSDYTGACYLDRVAINTVQCAGLHVYEDGCPGGFAGTQYSVMLNGDEIEILCVDTGAQARSVPAAPTGLAGLLP